MMTPWLEPETLRVLAQGSHGALPALALAATLIGARAAQVAADEAWLGAEAWVDPARLRPDADC